MYTSFCFLALSLWLPAADPKDYAAKQALEKMQGSWKVEKLVRDGVEASASNKATISIVIMGNQLTIKTEKGQDLVMELALDPTGKPAQLEVKPLVNEVVKAQKGIYEFDGDTLRLCWARQDGDRPKAFESKLDAKSVLFELKKEKK